MVCIYSPLLILPLYIIRLANEMKHTTKKTLSGFRLAISPGSDSRQRQILVQLLILAPQSCVCVCVCACVCVSCRAH